MKDILGSCPTLQHSESLKIKCTDFGIKTISDQATNGTRTTHVDYCNIWVKGELWKIDPKLKINPDYQ